MRHPGSPAGSRCPRWGLCPCTHRTAWLLADAACGSHRTPCGEQADAGATSYRRRRGPCRLLGDEQRCTCVPSADAIDPKLSFGRRRVASVKAATLIIRCSSSNPRQQRRWHHYAKLSLATCRKESFTGCRKENAGTYRARITSAPLFPRVLFQAG